MAIHKCAECLKKPRDTDQLAAALQRLKPKLSDQERQACEGFFGAAPPSGKRPVKGNPPPPTVPKRQGARPGPLGVGRHTFDPSPAARVGDIPAVIDDRGPDCDAFLEDKGTDNRAVIERHRVKADRVLDGLSE